MFNAPLRNRPQRQIGPLGWTFLTILYCYLLVFLAGVSAVLFTPYATWTDMFSGFVWFTSLFIWAGIVIFQFITLSNAVWSVPKANRQRVGYPWYITLFLLIGQLLSGLVIGIGNSLLNNLVVVPIIVLVSLIIGVYYFRQMR